MVIFNAKLFQRGSPENVIEITVTLLVAVDVNNFVYLYVHSVIPINAGKKHTVEFRKQKPFKLKLNDCVINWGLV